MDVAGSMQTSSPATGSAFEFQLSASCLATSVAIALLHAAVAVGALSITTAKAAMSGTMKIDSVRGRRVTLIVRMGSPISVTVSIQSRGWIGNTTDGYFPGSSTRHERTYTPTQDRAGRFLEERKG